MRCWVGKCISKGKRPINQMRRLMIVNMVAAQIRIPAGEPLSQAIAAIASTQTAIGMGTRRPWGTSKCCSSSCTWRC